MRKLSIITICLCFFLMGSDYALRYPTKTAISVITPATAVLTYVPYTGANATVDLGAHELTTTGTVDASGHNITDKFVTVTTFTDEGINAAIDALGAEGGEVYLPEGTYEVNSTITIDYDNTTLSGAGAGTILQVPNSTGNLNIISMTSKNDCIVSDLAIDGNNDNNASDQVGVFIDGGTGHQVLNNWIYNISADGATYGDGVYVANVPSGMVIDGNNFQDIDDDAMDINALVNSVVSNNYGLNIGGNGIDTEAAFYLTITGNVFDTCGDNGIELEMEDAGSTLYCAVTGNTISNTIDYAITIGSASYNTVTGNVIQNDTAGSATGIYLGNVGGTDAEHNVISGNLITGMATGIEEESGEADHNYISGNHVTGNTTDYVITGANTKAFYEDTANEFTSNVDIGLLAQQETRYYDADSSHYVGLKAPATVASSIVFTTPDADGNANESLITDGSLGLGWLATYYPGGTDVAITDGGTGESTAGAGFNALSPLTTKGDLISWTTGGVRVSVGANDEIIVADSTQSVGWAWEAHTAPAHDFDSASHGNVNAMTEAKGDMLVWDGTNNYWVDLDVGTNAYVLTANSAVADIGIEWATPGAPTGHTLDSASHSDTNSLTESKGMSWWWDSVAEQWDALDACANDEGIVYDDSVDIGVKCASLGGGSSEWTDAGAYLHPADGNEYVAASNTGTRNYADGDGDMYVENDLEVDGSVYLGTIKGLKLNVVEKTAAYTLTQIDDVVIVSTAGGAVTLTLPAVASSTGKVFYIKVKTLGAGLYLTIDGNASETIDDVTTLVLDEQYDSVMIVCDGSEWWEIY